MARRVEVSPFDRAYEGVLEYIDSHDLKEGDRLPSERELCVALNVSRTTLRSALAQLSAHFLVECRPGAGNFVRPQHPIIHLNDLSGFSEIVAKIGKTAQARVLSNDIVPCPAPVAPLLGLSEGEPVFRLRRVRGIEDEVACLQTSYVFARACPGIEDIDFAQASLAETMRTRYGMDAAHTSITVTVVRAGAEDAAALEIPKNSLVFFERGRRTNANGAPVEYTETLYIPERIGVVCTTVFERPGNSGDSLREGA